MTRLFLFVVLCFVSITTLAQQQLISHWVPYQLNDSIFGNDVSNFGILETSNAQDVFQVSYNTNTNIPKAFLQGIITKKEQFNQSLNNKISLEELQIVETNQYEIKGYPIQLKLLKNKTGEHFYATCFSLAYDIPPTFDLCTSWEGTEVDPIHNMLYYELTGPQEAILIEILEKIFDKLDKDAAINWSPVQTSTSDLDVSEISNLDLIIYPNPTSEYIKIESQNPKTMQIIIYNHQGKQMIKKINHDTNQAIKVDQLHQGNYLITVQNKNQIITKKFVKI